MIVANVETVPNDYLKRILDARIYDLAIQTPLDRTPLISERICNTVLLKREDLQPVFSFKIRGAYNKLLHLTPQQKRAGVIAASAGNHAQGLALSAKHLGIKAIIVMPKTTPAIKYEAVKRHGAEIILEGDAYDHAARYAKTLVKSKNMTYIPPFDDPSVIAGQGTVAMEILQQHPKNIDAIFIPVGGGGLCAGMVAYIKSVRPSIKVFAVEAEDSACLKASMEARSRIIIPHVGIFAEGVAVAQIGQENFKVIQPLIDGVITVCADEICAAIKDIFDDARAIAEPAGALSLAGLKKYTQTCNITGQTLIAVNSGANTNFDRLRYIVERTEVGEKREAVFAVTIPEVLGSFKAFCSVIGKREITEFNYRFSGVNKAHVFVGLRMNPEASNRQALADTLRYAGYHVVDMTENEMAKSHVRHMVGGDRVENELVYRFEFPERPGALLDFLRKLEKSWNITLFHYRNHGSAFGRVLVGLKVASHSAQELTEKLRELKFNFWEETSNEAYQLFLRGESKARDLFCVKTNSFLSLQA